MISFLICNEIKFVTMLQGFLKNPPLNTDIFSDLQPKAMDTTKAANSAATTENQMPKTPKNAGRIKIAAISNKKVRKRKSVQKPNRYSMR